MARVWENSQHAGSDLLMLLAIADFSDDDGNAYPGVATLAKKCRMTQRNANLILANLKRSGELVVRQNEGPRGTNRYVVRPPEACFAPEEHFTLKRTSEPPERHFPKPLKPASDESSKNHQEPSNIDEDFNSFWNQYPRKVAKSAALKAWKKLKPASEVLADLMAGLQRHKASRDWQKDDGQYIPYPATWITGRRWEDDVAQGMPAEVKGSAAGPKPGDTRQRHGILERFDEVAGWVPA